MAARVDMATIQRGARVRRSPFFDATSQAGCWGYTVYNHMLLPIGYDDLEREYWKLVHEVTVWDVSVERQCEIAGPDAFTLTNMMTPRDLSKCAVGQGKYIVMTGEDGGIINDPVLLRLEENRFWLAAADSDILLWAKGLAHGLGLDVEITEPDVSPMQIQGPNSKSVVQALFGDAVVELKYYYFLEADVDGIPVIVTRTGWSGEVGYEIYLRDSRRGVELWNRVMEAGRPYGITPTGPSDIRRVEAGILNYGIDMTIENTPYEVGLDWMVKLEDGSDFIGREALQRVAAEGVRRKLVGVEIEGDRLGMNMTRWPVSAGGKAVGQITSALYSPRLKKNIGYAMVPVEHADLGVTLETETPDGTRGTVVVQKPFVDPEKAVPKS